MTGPHDTRIHIIDSLRGLALFGILLTHCVTQFFGVMPEAHRDILNHSIFDSIFTYGISFILGAKFFLVFAFLFGVSFAIQFKKFESKSESFNKFHLQRMFWLIVFGLLNFSFFQGDILIVYGLLAISLIAVQNVSNRCLLILAILLFSGLPRTLIYSYQLLFGDTAILAEYLNPEQLLVKNYIAATSYSFVEIVKLNFENWSKMISIFQLGYFGRGYQVLASFLIGILVFRLNFFSNIMTKQYTKTRLFKVSLFLIFIFAGISSYLYTINPTLDFSHFSGIMMVTFYDWFNIAFTVCMVLFFIELSKKKIVTPIYNILKWPGRMSLTIYIMQSIFFTAFYFDWGLGRFNTHGSTFSVFIALVFFGVQCLFAYHWFKLFKQGPLESIWRKLILR